MIDTRPPLIGGYNEFVPPSPVLATELIDQVNNIPDGIQAIGINSMHFGVISLASEYGKAHPSIRVTPWASDKLTPPSTIRTEQIISHWLGMHGEERIETAVITPLNEGLQRNELLERFRKGRRMLVRACVDKTSLGRIDPFLVALREHHTPSQDTALHVSSAAIACGMKKAPFAIYQIGRAPHPSQPEKQVNIVRALHPNLVDPTFAFEATKHALESRIVPKQVYSVSPDQLLGSSVNYNQGRWR